MLVYKIAGALAGRGASLDEVYHTAQWVSTRLGTIGVGLEHCHVSRSSPHFVTSIKKHQVPGTDPSKSHLSSTEVEVGMGIHNEAGFTRLSPVPPIKDLVAQLLGLITSTSDPDRSFVPFKNDGSDEVVLLVNNLGGLSELELGGVAAEAMQLLEGKAKVRKVLVGSFMVLAQFSLHICTSLTKII